MSSTSPLHEALAQAGAVFENEAATACPLHFGDPQREYQAARDGAALFDVSTCGKLRVSGKDAATWLHNLCTNDVKGLPEGQFCEAFFTTPKARVLGHVLLYHGPAEPWGPFLLDMVPGQADRLFKHLNFHIISEDVELTSLDGQLAHLRLLGPQAPALVAQIFSELPVGPTGTRWQRLTTWNAQPVAVSEAYGYELPGVDLFCAPSAASDLWRRLVELGATPAGTQALEILRVEAGFPEYGKDIDENRLVMEVGRTAQAISYTKGCFLGQEPIVMARDRGQVNRTFLGVTTDGEPLTPGARLMQGETEVGQATSSVVSVRLGKPIALAYLRRGFQTPGTQLVAYPPGTGQPVLVCTLPFVPGRSGN